jgi:ABC-2 type transport system permease protein
MPDFLQSFSRVLPSTHLADALRLIAANGAGIGNLWFNIAVLAGWTVGCLVLAIKFFRWE